MTHHATRGGPFGGRAVVKHILAALFAALLFPCLCFPAAVTGIVVDGRGSPVPAFKLALLLTETGQRFVISTNADGRFSRQVSAGEYAIFTVEPESSIPLMKFTLLENESRSLVFHLSERGLLSAPAAEKRVGEAQPASRERSLELVGEYRIQSDNAGATQASAGSGALAELVNPFPQQKRGRIHGSIYEFHRNDNFDARNFFDPPGKPLPEYKRNQFGVSLGIAVGGRMNFLGTYDGLRISQGLTLLSHLPTAEMKRGNFAALPVRLLDPLDRGPLEGNTIPQNRIHPVSKRLLALYPDPNQSDPDRNFVNNQPMIRNRDTRTLRWDFQPKTGSTLFVRYEISDAESTYVHSLPTLGSVRTERDQGATISYNDKLSSQFLISTRFDFIRTLDYLTSVNAGKGGLLESIGIPGLAAPDPADQGYPEFRLSGYASFGDAGLPVLSVNNSFTYDAQATWMRGSHSIRFGANFTAYQTNNNRADGLRKGRFVFNGYYTGDAFADFLLGSPDSVSRAIGTDRSDIRRKATSLFVRDEWKIGPRLSLSAGLNYTYFQPYRSLHNNVSVFHPLVLEPPSEGQLLLAGSKSAMELGLGGAGDGGMVFPDRNDWAPSAAFAFRPLGNNSLVARSGFYLTYAPLGRDTFASYLSRNYPFYYVETAQSPTTEAQLSLTSPFEAAVASEVGVRGIEPRSRTTLMQNWYLILQWEVGRMWRIEGAYRGSRGTHMARTLPGNVPTPAEGLIQPRRPNPRFGRFTILSCGGAYTRNLLELDAERRLGGGISLKSGFTWTSYFSDLYRSNPANPRNLRAERARADYVPSRQFHMTYIMDLPFGREGKFGRHSSSWLLPLISGWRLSGITNFQDGTRFSVVSRGDPNNDGVSEDHPDRLGSGLIKSRLPSVDRWFDTEAFAAAAPYSYGNSGRNILTGPPSVNWDLSVIKQTRFSDGQMIEFRIELFNAFNQVSFEQPNSLFGTSLFGKIFGAHRAREIEIALRYSF